MMNHRRDFFSRRVRFGCLLAVAVWALPACGTADNEPASLDADLSRDLSLASEAGAPDQAVFGDTAATEPDAVIAEAPPVAAPTPRPAPAPAPSRERAPAPVRPTPTPPAPQTSAPVETPDVPAAAPAPAPEPSRRTALSAGTELLGNTGTKVCSDSNRPGDRVVMRLSSEVIGPDGTRLEAGTPVLLELASVSDSVLVFRVRGVSVDGDIQPVVATASVETELEGARVASGSDKKKIIGGAILGAIAGQVLGKDTKSTVIGAAGGAAAGTIAARRSGSSELCLPAGGRVRVVLDQDLVITGKGA